MTVTRNSVNKIMFNYKTLAKYVQRISILGEIRQKGEKNHRIIKSFLDFVI